MFVQKILANELIDILAAPSYSPEILSYVNKISDAVVLKDFLIKKPKLGVTGTIAKDYVSRKTPDAIPYISTKQVSGLYAYIEDAKFISKSADIEWEKCRVYDGNIVINKSGNVGAAAIVKASPYKYVNSVSDIISIEINESLIDKEYLVVYLNSPYGQKQLQRLSGGAIFDHVSLHAIPNIKIFSVSILAQKYIGDKVRQAELLREWVKGCNKKINNFFSNLVSSKMEKSKIYIVKKEELDNYRINPKQYDPVVVNVLKTCEQHLEPLSSFMDERGIAGGATPKGASYQNSGVLFCRVQNVKRYSLDLSDSVFIDNETNSFLARSECREDDIILTITGYPGVASLVTEYDLPLNINQHSVRFGVNDKISVGYLCAALNSDFLKLQVDRSAIGGTRDALDYPSVSNLLIPRFDSSKELEIHKLVIDLIFASQIATKLIDVSKSIVEGLIEGLITEEALIQAQHTLEQGDTSLDRAILSQMTEDGYTVAGSKPLFADLDEFYDLLEQAKALE